MYVFDGGHDPRHVSHEALRQTRAQLRRHPVITAVAGLPHDTLHRELRADVDPSSIGVDAPGGTLTVRWFVSDPTDPVRFTFHYSNVSGFDCGWHHHEQEHVAGLGHYQHRASGRYLYEEYTFGSKEPPRVVWEVVAQLETVLTETQ